MQPDEPTIKKLDELSCCVIIPTFNNAGSLHKVISEVKCFASSIIVINDGSTDGTQEILNGTEKINSFSFPVNRGKGMALRKGFEIASEMGFRYAITIDSDGQHDAADIAAFASLAEKEPGSFIMGARNMNSPAIPGGSRFGHKFSIFWFWIETGQRIEDVQSGFRLYPLEMVERIKHFYTGKYEFEVEILVRLAWRGTKLLSVPVSVYYAPPSERVSHFRKGPDFARTSLLNAVLVFAALLWVRPFMFIRDLRKKSVKAFIRDNVINSADSNEVIAFSVILGVFIGIVPIWGWQLILAFSLAHLLKLNKFVTLAAVNISIPPLLPFVIYGSYVTGGWLLASGETGIPLPSALTFQWVKANLLQFILGSFVFGAVLSLLFGFLTWILLRFLRKPKVI
jgi:glycosyltransferase involved in cell wall biosynthesis